LIIRPKPLSTLTLLFSLKGSIIPAIWRKVLFTVLVSSAVVAIHGTLFNFKVILTATPFTLWGLTLAIFLGFRNTVAYQRFWEARTLWGELLIVSRNLTRQSLSLLAGLSREHRRDLAEGLIVFSRALKNDLRADPQSPEIQAWIDKGHEHPGTPKSGLPNAVLGELGKRYMAATQLVQTSPVVQVDIDQQLSRLSSVFGGCERISNTPIPYPYILMLHRIVHIYCFLLPFCLVDTIGWFTPFAVCVLAYTFFGLDALGDQIADPFDKQPNDLPLEAMCRNLEISVLELLDEPAPAALQPTGDVLL
jgi:putative membrane protein